MKTNNNYLIQSAINTHEWYTEARSSRPELAKRSASKIHREYKGTKWIRVVAVVEDASCVTMYADENGDRVIWSRM